MSSSAGGSDRGDGAAARTSRRPQAFKARSIRGLLDVIPAQDLRFTGLTVGWVGVGFIRAVSRKAAK